MVTIKCLSADLEEILTSLGYHFEMSPIHLGHPVVTCTISGLKYTYNTEQTTNM